MKKVKHMLLLKLFKLISFKKQRVEVISNNQISIQIINKNIGTAKIKMELLK